MRRKMDNLAISEEEATEYLNRRKKRRNRRTPSHLGAPFEFKAEVRRSTTGIAPYIVAELIYRRTCVTLDRTVFARARSRGDPALGRSIADRRLGKLTAPECATI